MTTLHLSKRNLFDRVGYKPHPGQLVVHRSTASRRVVAAGARFGKSTLGAMELVAALLEPRERSLGWLLAPNFDVTDRIFRPAAQALDAHFPELVREISPREHKIVVTNLGGGVSEMRAKSADTPASLLGEGLDWLIVDEVARLRPEVWDAYLAQRLIDRRGWALLISTPNGCNWFRTLFKRGLGGRDPAFESWSFPSWANPHVPRELIEAERARLPREVFEQEFGGKFAGQDDEPCDLCGGPARELVGILMLGEFDQIPECTSCAKPVNASGRTLVGAWDKSRGPTGLTRVCVPKGEESLLEQIKRDWN